MREIKFRAFNKNRQEMVYSVKGIDNRRSGTSREAERIIFRDIDGNVYSYYKSDDGDNWIEIENNAVIMQFTGLRGYLGREIYEDDIVELDKDYYKMPNNKFIVKYKDNRFSLFDKSGNELLGYDDWWLYSKVIGNIYENFDKLNNLYKN
jgi:hypothetical protein